jgi:hypothetical protein
MKKTWIKVKRGLVKDAKHRRALGVRIWLYLHILDRANWEDGIVYEWIDKHEAEDLEMPWRTLQDQRRQLEEDGYITCHQKKRHQNIVIHKWTNPREYSGEIYNNKGAEKHVPSKESVKGADKGTRKGSIKPRTPTSNSQDHKLTDSVNHHTLWTETFGLYPKSFDTKNGDNTCAITIEEVLREHV